MGGRGSRAPARNPEASAAPLCALEIRVLWTSNRRGVVGVAYFFVNDYDQALVVNF